MNTELAGAFRNAVYRVRTGRGTVDVRVGRIATARRLRARLTPPPGADVWVVTACNPGGRRTSAARNQRQRRALHRLADRRGLPHVAAHNLDPDGNWPVEPGLCLWGTTAREAAAIGRRFGQAAILRVPRNGAPRLVWL